MKAKLSRGSGFGGVLRYTTEKDGAETIGGTMAGDKVRDLVHEFAVLSALRPDVVKKVWHASLALPEGERLSSENWNAVAVAFMSSMGFDERHAWTAWRHCDTSHDHLHIVASRVGCDGTLWHGSQDVHRAIKLTSELEQQFDLVRTKGYSRDTANQTRTPSKPEIEQALRIGEQPVRVQLAAAITAATQGSPTMSQFIDRIESAGIGISFNQSVTTGRISGISFKKGGVAFKGSSLGKAYSINSILKEINYEQARDYAAIALHSAVGSRNDDTTRTIVESVRPNNNCGGAAVEFAVGRSGGNCPTPCGTERGPFGAVDSLGALLEQHARERTQSRGARRGGGHGVEGSRSRIAGDNPKNGAQYANNFRGVPLRGASSRLLSALVARTVSSNSFDNAGLERDCPPHNRIPNRVPTTASDATHTIDIAKTSRIFER